MASTPWFQGGTAAPPPPPPMATPPMSPGRPPYSPGPTPYSPGPGTPPPPQQQQPRPGPRPPPGLDANQVGYLEARGYSSGLIRAFGISVRLYPLRWFVIDNSLSMQTRDSHRLVGRLEGGAGERIGMVDCTRWQEVQDCVPVHAELAGVVGLPCRFVFLNDPGRYGGPRHFSVGERGPSAARSEIQEARTIMSRATTNGATPLARHINDVYDIVAPMASTLMREGRRVAVVLATDGLPSDEMGNEGQVILQQFVASLQRLERLPVSIVVRLATDDDAVVDFYNSVDRQLGDLPYDVLDDYYGEALEVYLRNPWLTYSLSLHRFRELGVHVPAIDHLDTEELSLKELRDFCSVLFADRANGYAQLNLPDSETNWPAFVNAVAELQGREQPHFNPVTKRVCPWLDLALLDATYGKGRHGQRPLPAQVPMRQLSKDNLHDSGRNLGQQQYGFPTSPMQQRRQQYTSPMQQHGRQQSVPAMQHGFQQQGGFQQQKQQQQQPQGFGQAAGGGYNPFDPRQNAQSMPPMSSPPRPAASRPGAQWQRQQQRQRPAAPSAGRHAPPPPPQAAQQPAPYTPKTSSASPAGDNARTSAIKRGILTQWALRPPDLRQLRPIHELLCSVQETLPPAHGVPFHPYFGRWKPFATTALASGEAAVLKRAMRKVKFFLHPDKLPRDLTSEQSFVCTLLWHTMSDAWEEFEKR